MFLKRYLPVMLFFLSLYLVILGPFARYMGNKPYTEKLGLIPNPGMLKATFSDYQGLVGASILAKVTLYFGTLLEGSNSSNKLAIQADYPAMSRAIHAALHLDPYNMDGYYFGQSILVWDVGQYKLATELLEYGMQYRTWDWQLPFFAAFNQAYFLKNRVAAARLYMRAGELSGSPLFKSLAGRYLQEAGETQMAIDYLQTIEKSTRSAAIKQTLRVRIDTFKAVLTIEQARDRYAQEQGHFPLNIDVLVKTGYLATKPIDHYGGEFYLDENGQVHSTSKYAFSPLRRSAEDGSATPATDK